MGREPLISYLYRLIGLFVAVVLLVGSVITASLLQVPFIQPLIGAVFGAILIFTGIMASETWAFKACRRLYVPAGAPYSQHQLTLSVIGFFVTTIMIVLLTLQIQIL